MLRFICTLIVGVNILTLCYAAEQGKISVVHRQRRDVVPVQHVPVANPEIPKGNNNDNQPAAVAEEQKPLVIYTSELDKGSGVNRSVVVGEKPQTITEAPKRNVTTDNEIAGHISGDVPEGFDVGALKRGSLVFLLLCVIILACYAWKTYRLRKASTSPLMVQKYGVRTNRSDIEMRPLPLDEDDDDDTLFEIGNNTNQQ